MATPLTASLCLVFGFISHCVIHGSISEVLWATHVDCVRTTCDVLTVVEWPNDAVLRA
jgi:hypothetical protein